MLERREPEPLSIILVTTTINVPEVLREYRKLDESVPFIVVGDERSPHGEISGLAAELGNCEYLSPSVQQMSWPRISTALRWNNIQRRNIGILEAALRGPDIILSIDDDNAPVEASYFDDLRRAFSSEHQGNVAIGEWFNIGALAQERFRYRGFPRTIEPTCQWTEGSASIGVVNGLIFGDPDINATERMENHPWVTSYAPEALAGIAVGGRPPQAPINSQNTAYRLSLAPLALVLPSTGRYDDIWGSYIAQRVMSELGWSTLYGRPFVHQERNAQDLLRNLKDELFGLEHTEAFLERLWSIPLTKGPVLDMLRELLLGLRGLEVPLPHNFFDCWLSSWHQVGPLELAA